MSTALEGGLGGEQVRAGQVWQDCDKRMAGRTVVVQRVDDDYAYCVQVGAFDLRPIRTRPIRLLKRRMKPTNKGWRLVAQPEQQTKD